MPRIELKNVASKRAMPFEMTVNATETSGTTRSRTRTRRRP
jgi:antitoxin component of RelBE/YafQ-DinJ toxin-antitoxin module